jgi:hypothetical protein
MAGDRGSINHVAEFFHSGEEMLNRNPSIAWIFTAPKDLRLAIQGVTI